jgi:molybdate transport system substrate-binding protein
MKQTATSLLVVMLLALLAACGGPAATVSPSDPSASTADVVASSAAAPNGAAAGQTELLVFAAASLTDAFGEIGKNFEAANPGVNVTFNFAGSQQLVQQITQGAPADVFASANRAQMEHVIQAGDVISGTEQVFARNRLVVIYPAANPAGLTALEDLARPGVKLVLAAKEVPIGGYSLDFLRKASELPQFTSAYSDTVLANVVSYEENVRAVLSKVALGEADAGIVYSSDVTRDAADKIGRIDIPDALNTLATYPIAPVSQAPNPALAQSFVDYVLTAEAQQALVKYGFITASGDAGGAP